MTAIDRAHPGFEDQVIHAFRRVIDAAEDAKSDAQLEAPVRQQIAALDAAQREVLICMLAGTIARLLARKRQGRSGPDDAFWVNRTVGGLVGAARTASDRQAFDNACQQLTGDLTKIQLSRVCSALAAEIAQTRL